MQQLYGISGLPTIPESDRRLEYARSISGFSQFGRQTSNPQFQNPTSFNPKLNYSWIKGRHSLKMGYEFVGDPHRGAGCQSALRRRHLCRAVQQADLRAARPSRGCTIASDATSYNLADFIFGLPSTIQLGNNFVTNLRQHVHSLYVQDDYRVTSKLTLNLGLRWEFATPLWERDNNWTNFDPSHQHAGQSHAAAVSTIARWCIRITKTSARGSGWHTARLRRP